MGEASERSGRDAPAGGLGSGGREPKREARKDSLIMRNEDAFPVPRRPDEAAVSEHANSVVLPPTPQTGPMGETLDEMGETRPLARGRVFSPEPVAEAARNSWGWKLVVWTVGVLLSSGLTIFLHQSGQLLYLVPALLVLGIVLYLAVRGT